MTAKLKAKELVDKYRKYVDDGRHNGFYSGEITWNNQKKCALIAVDEILTADMFMMTEKQEIYWEQVISEIEIL
jgi:hypothetical protein